MSAAWVSSSVRLPDFIRTTTFRWTLAIASAFVLYTLVLFGFVYWQTAAYVMSESDVFLANELSVFAANTPEQRLAEIDDRLRKDPRHVKVAGLFGREPASSTSCRRRPLPRTPATGRAQGPARQSPRSPRSHRCRARSRGFRRSAADALRAVPSASHAHRRRSERPRRRSGHRRQDRPAGSRCSQRYDDRRHRTGPQP